MDSVRTEGDRIGLGWRSELAAGIFAHLDQIDLLEVIADDFVSAPSRARRMVRTLARQVPVTLHGIGLGLAAATPIPAAKIDDFARLVGEVEPVSWSEHLSFVRGGGVEIGHLAAPPRNAGSVAAIAHNVSRLRAAVGRAPLAENIATLVAPPASSMSEVEWLNAIAADSGAELLLDLHNLHANAHNFGFDALAALAALPLQRVGAVHLAGGRRLANGRLLDDHLHPVPAAVYILLTELAARCPRPLDVIVERDGRYPPFPELLAELAQARAALSAGRARRRQSGATPVGQLAVA